MGYRLSPQLENYVKFVRGTPAAWNNLPVAERNSDTLYFISENDATSGKLYLGNKLISGSGEGGSINIASLNDLEDVLVSSNIPANSFLVFNGTSGKWENKSLTDVYNLIATTMVGADASHDGVEGLVPVPTAGQQNLFLRGDATWADPTENFQAAIDGLQNQLDNLLDETVTPSIYSIATDIVTTQIADLINNAPSQFDTLKEIADWIVSNDSAVGAAEQLQRLNDVVFGKDATEETINNWVEAVDTTSVLDTLFGNGDDDLGLVANVGNLQTALNTLEGRVDTTESDIIAIYEKLRWQLLEIADGE